MKTLVKIFAFLFLLPLAGFAHNDHLETMLAKYNGQPGFHFLDVNTNMMSDDISKVVHLKLLSFNAEENSSFDTNEIYGEFMKNFDRSDYKGLVEVKSSGDNVEMMVKQEGEQISEFLITIKGEMETVLISASGNFSMTDIAKFSDFENCKGLQVLEQLCEE